MKNLLLLIVACTNLHVFAQCAWQPLGPDDRNQASIVSVTGLNLTVDKNGVPYIGHNGGVFKFVNNKWTNVGNSQTGSTPDIVVDKNGTPYIVYGSVVEKYDGVKWDTLGAYGGGSTTAQLFLDSGGVPYVVYDVAGTSATIVTK